MELFFFDAGLVSVYAGREQRSDWGVSMASGNCEVWAGQAYICASFDKQKTKTAARYATALFAAFTIGLMMDPPESLARINPLSSHVEAAD